MGRRVVQGGRSALPRQGPEGLDEACATSIASASRSTQLIGLLAMFSAMFGLSIPAEVQGQVAVAITAIITVATWILRTFFHKKAPA
jgi:hypothetical protein